jgi:hypothetical protein
MKTNGANNDTLTKSSPTVYAPNQLSLLDGDDDILFHESLGITSDKEANASDLIVYFAEKMNDARTDQERDAFYWLMNKVAAIHVRDLTRHYLTDNVIIPIRSLFYRC